VFATGNCTEARCELSSTCLSCEQQSSCVWCESAQKCVTRVSFVTELGFGQCLTYSGDACREACSALTSCDACLADVRCGWCSNLNLLGQGTCEAGTMEHSGLYAPDPQSLCNGGPGRTSTSATTATTRAVATTTMTTTAAPGTTTTVSSSSSSSSTTAVATTTTMTTTTTTTSAFAGNFTWHYFSCPDKDECQLGVHRCSVNATCLNVDNLMDPTGLGYRCLCPEDHVLLADNVTCQPTCLRFGCVNGSCVAPNQCRCSLGFTGTNCSTDCGCNGHSFCERSGPGVCDECMNATTGPTCGSCKPGHHGNATNGGRCLTCYEACHGHSNVCKPLPTDAAPICSGCGNNTFGSYCEQCGLGYFISPAVWPKAVAAGYASTRAYVDGEPGVVFECVPCRCNGHGSVCNPNSGEDCDCRNMTQTSASSCSDARRTDGSCWRVQCAQCMDKVRIGEEEANLEGDPVNGSLCFVIASPDTEFLGRLTPGEIEHFTITPRYTNVHLRFFVEGPPQAMLRAYITDTRNVSRSPATGELLFGRPPLATVTVVGRRSIVISSSENNFETGHFYAVIELVLAGGPVDASGGVPYRFFVVQKPSTINLFVFFAVFFSSFFLFLASVIVIFKIKLRVDHRHQAIEQAQRLESMARRPLAQLMLLLPSEIITGPARVAVANASSAGLLPLKPITEQPHVSGLASVTTVLVELPTDGRHRNLCVGSALVLNPNIPEPQKRNLRRRSQARFSATSV
jgi:hypothetical protein